MLLTKYYSNTCHGIYDILSERQTKPDPRLRYFRLKKNVSIYIRLIWLISRGEHDLHIEH